MFHFLNIMCHKSVKLLKLTSTYFIFFWKDFFHASLKEYLNQKEVGNIHLNGIHQALP